MPTRIVRTECTLSSHENHTAGSRRPERPQDAVRLSLREALAERTHGRQARFDRFRAGLARRTDDACQRGRCRAAWPTPARPEPAAAGDTVWGLGYSPMRSWLARSCRRSCMTQARGKRAFQGVEATPPHAPNAGERQPR